MSHLNSFVFVFAGPGFFNSSRPCGRHGPDPEGKREQDRGSFVFGDHVNLGRQTTPGSADRLGSVTFPGAGAVGMHLHRGAVQARNFHIDYIFFL